MRHRAQQLRPPNLKVIHIVSLDRVLIHRVAATSANAQVLRGLEKCRRAGNPVQLRTKPVDHFSSTDLSLAKRLQDDKDVSGVGSAATSREANDVLHRRIFLDDILNLEQAGVHNRERSVLRATYRAS